jgi:hypothetical protein
MRNLKGALLAFILLATLALTACGGYAYHSYRVLPPGAGAMGYAPGYRVRPHRPRAVRERPRGEPREHDDRDHRSYWR